MIAYKLFRKLKSGELSSLFINKKLRYSFNKVYFAEEHPTNGYAFRPFFHCFAEPEAPHLSKKNRVWVKVDISDYKKLERPNSQGCNWYVAKQMKLIEEHHEKAN